MTETLDPTLPGEVTRLVEQVLRTACAKGLALATAESCTGGLLASLLTDVDGYAHAFERGFVVYSDEAKHQMLGVPIALIRRAGAVSEDVAREMAKGAIANSAADVAIAITGFAGPGGPGEEPGLVHFAVSRRSGPTAHREEHFGDVGRGDVRLGCLRVGLELLLGAVQVRPRRPRRRPSVFAPI
jgi:nicotinamide-nucleotide amidase